MNDIDKVIKQLETVINQMNSILNGSGGFSTTYVKDTSQEAIQTIRELREDCNRYHEWGMHEGYEEAKEQIPKWHLCPEELPNDRQWYLAMFQEVDTGFIGFPYIADYLNGRHTKYTTDDGWIISNCTDREDSSAEYYKKLRCVAWMELPKFSEVE